jgi:uncharacterized protein (DUF983 family)
MIALSLGGFFVYIVVGIIAAGLLGRYDHKCDEIAGAIVILWPPFLVLYALAMLYKLCRGGH